MHIYKSGADILIYKNIGTCIHEYIHIYTDILVGRAVVLHYAGVHVFGNTVDQIDDVCT